MMVCVLFSFLFLSFGDDDRVYGVVTCHGWTWFDLC